MELEMELDPAGFDVHALSGSGTLNPSNAMKPALTRANVLDALRQHRSDLLSFGVRTIALFGSYANDASTHSSDLDCVVEFSEPTYDNFTALEQFLEDLFQRPVDILTPAGVDSIRVPSITEDIKQTLVHV